MCTDITAGREPYRTISSVRITACFLAHPVPDTEKYIFLILFISESHLSLKVSTDLLYELIKLAEFKVPVCNTILICLPMLLAAKAAALVITELTVEEEARMILTLAGGFFTSVITDIRNYGIYLIYFTYLIINIRRKIEKKRI